MHLNGEGEGGDKMPFHGKILQKILHLIFHIIMQKACFLMMLAMTQGNWSLGVLTRCDRSRTVQLQKMARSLLFRIYGEEELYYPCSENKSTDQLCNYCTADLRLCFHI